MRTRIPSSKAVSVVVPFVAALLLAGCKGDDGDPGPPGPPGGSGTASTNLEPEEDPPGIVLAITSLGGATGAGGNFRAGDTMRVTFTAERNDGSDWMLSEFSRGRILVSGPTFNYQRVLPEQTDLHTASVTNADGSHTYTFGMPIPATYVAPVNDTPSFDADDGELTGQALLSGTYTLGIYMSWDYTVEGESFRDTTVLTHDFLLGSATTLAPREVVTQDNCNQCHESIRAHGGFRQGVTLCLLCHTAGAEDRNNPAVAGGTPGASVDFKVMIHKIHNGAHLPSVLGVDTNPDGSRNYAALPEPYLLAGFSLADFSHVEFPIWPNGMFPTPRDEGYAALAGGEQSLEDAVRTGVTSCDTCHGDPDGAGPLGAPAQGMLAYMQPSRNACGACHDDVDWSLPYTANSQTMPAQATDSACTLCHEVSGSALDVIDAHRHPLRDPLINPGLNYQITAVDEAGMANMNGSLDPGERVAVTFTITDDNGLDVDPADVASMTAVVSGPTSNYNLLLHASFPPAALSGPQPYTMNLPERVELEAAGANNPAMLQTFATARSPHWDVAGADTALLLRTGLGAGATMLTSAASAPQNYVDVASAAGFARNDYVVLDDGGMGEEYLRIQHVDGTRLWFSSPAATSGYQPGLRLDHPGGTSVTEITVAAVPDTSFTVDAMNGMITETVEFGASAGDVLATYVTDFVVPAVYPLQLNDSPDIDETFGEWTGKSLVDGTYSVGLWGNRNLSVNLFGETTTYRGTAEAARMDFLVGGAALLEPYDLISSGQNCNACHDQLWFHGGGRRGFDSCLLCHGTVGSEDRPQYVAANAPPTTATSIALRTMLHKIHMGADLANASSYTLVGFGPPNLYPNNFSTHTYEEVVFPALPGGTQDCAKCHGTSDAWQLPADRDHPTEQGMPVRSWRAVCGACHDSTPATAHIDANTSPAGAEACSVCHSLDDAANVPVVHKVR